MDQMKRRDFMRGTAIGTLAFTVGGAQLLLTPREARAQGVPFRLLKANEAEEKAADATLTKLAESTMNRQRERRKTRGTMDSLGSTCVLDANRGGMRESHTETDRPALCMR